MNKFVALLDVGEMDLLPMTVRAKKKSEVEKKLIKYTYKKLIEIVPVDEFNKHKSKWIVADPYY